MKTLKTFIYAFVLLLMMQVSAYAQAGNISETFKKHFNQTALKVEEAESADEKRVILNNSFNKMVKAIDRIESAGNFSDEESASLAAYKNNITLKSDQLNGLNGFDGIADKDLDDFSDYSQQDMEQANRTITVGLTTVLLVVLILLLL